MEYPTSDRGRLDIAVSTTDGGSGPPGAHDDRISAHGAYRGSRREAAVLVGEHAADAGLSRAATTTVPRGAAKPGVDVAPTPLDQPAMPIGELGPLTDPAFEPDAWLDPRVAALSEHPLVRGLMVELPPRGQVPDPEWLERWFDAARAVLTLLYVERDRGRR